MTTKKKEEKEQKHKHEKPEPKVVEVTEEAKPLLPALAQAVEVITTAAQATSDSERTDAEKIQHFASYIRELSLRLDRDALRLE